MSDYRTSNSHPVQSDAHAFATGLIAGCFMKGGFDVEVELDSEGNYLTSMLVDLPQFGQPICVVVLKPEES